MEPTVQHIALCRVAFSATPCGAEPVASRPRLTEVIEIRVAQRIRLFLLTAVLLFAVAPSAHANEAVCRQKLGLVLWYREPARQWNAAMPIGNGRIGAMVFGTPAKERIALNECTFWSGRPHDYNDPQAVRFLPQLRQLAMDGKFIEVEKLADGHFMATPRSLQAYQPLGNLRLDCAGHENATDYHRELDLENGIAQVRYRVGDALFTRETFCSYPDQVLVVRLTCNRPRQINVDASLDSPYLDKLVRRDSHLDLDGQWRGDGKPHALVAPVAGKGLRFRISLCVLAEGGTVVGGDSALSIRGADSATLILAAATSFRNYHDISADPAAACQKHLLAAGKAYQELRDAHVADFGSLMRAVQLDLGHTAAERLPVDERLAAAGDGADDPQLATLCFQFGRYLQVASSRPGGQPANLQGIWNEDPNPPWGSKWTTNINTQMNYWPAEVCNLAECHQPLFTLIRDLSETGTATAKAYYGLDGWVFHHNADLWRAAAPVDAPRYGLWPMGGAWLCRHLWDHYDFSGDREFLVKVYPIMRQSAAFLLEFLVEDPKHRWLVTPFSMSPENQFFLPNRRVGTVTSCPTMDIAILRDLFGHCIRASAILGEDAGFRARLETALERLPPYQVGKHGQLQEWLEDYDEPQPGMGHISHLFAFYPGDSITRRGTPRLAAAVRTSIERRMAHGGGSGGWPLAWFACVWARLGNGEQVHRLVNQYLAHSVGTNLHNRGANQSDASFGVTAGIAEALLQSHAGEIELLPALPRSWATGYAKGLRARGGLVVDIEWRDGRLSSAALRSSLAQTCKVRYRQDVTSLTLRPGRAARIDSNQFHLLDPQSR